MTLDEIKAAVQSGRTVHWSNDSYTVVENSGFWSIVHTGGYCIGLTWVDGVTMNGKPEAFYVAVNDRVRDVVDADCEDDQ